MSIFGDNDTLLQGFVKRGLADGTLGKLLAGGLTDIRDVAAGAVQTTIYDLNEKALPAAYLGQVGRGFIAIAWGTLAANANNKDIALKLGSGAMYTVTSNAGNNVPFVVVAVCFRDAVDSQRGFGFAIINQTITTNALFALTQDDAVALDVTLTLANTAAAATAGTGKGLAIIPISG